MKLSGQQRKILREGIIGAYPNPDDLKILLSEQMDVQLGEITRGDAYNAKVFSLIEDFQSRGKIEEFIRLIIKERLNSPYLRPVKAEFDSILRTTTNTRNSYINQSFLPFRLNYGFVRQFAEMDGDPLVQFVVTFSSQDDQDFSQIKIIKHICLILDVSASMDTADKYPYLLQAIPYVINTLSDHDWISIILFSSRSELIWSKSIANSRGHEKDIIQRIEQSGVKFEKTYLARGLYIGLNEIQNFNRKNSNAITRLYILTDGQLHDHTECYSLTPELRRLEIEVNSYGFGQDFAEETMRKIMEGCLGARVKSVFATNTLEDSFCHIGEAAQNIIATDAELEITFSPQTLPGDAFRLEPGVCWLGTVDFRKMNFSSKIGGLEKNRIYKYAFEARLSPFNYERECVATASLRYSYLGQQQVVQQEIFVTRIEKKLVEEYGEDWNQYPIIDETIQNWFLILGGLRTNDLSSNLASLKARLKILSDERADEEQIDLLENAINKLEKYGTLDGLSESQKRRLRADRRTTHRIGSRYSDEDLKSKGI